MTILKQQLRQKVKHNGNGKAMKWRAAYPVREVDFVLECAGAEEVYLCGDFNKWQPASLPMIGTANPGTWKKRLVLPAGRHEYKFVVDGKWLHDAEASENVRNIYGSFNSVVEVWP